MCPRNRLILLLTAALFAASMLVVSSMMAQSEPQPSTPVFTPSPTQPVIVFSANGQPSLMYSDLYGVFRVYLSTDLNAPLTDRASHAIQPRWSPDGTRIAFTLTGTADTPLRLPDGLTDSAIAIMAADGSNPVLITEGRGEYAPAWSPDGQTIAFASLPDRGVYLMDADGGNRRLVRDGVLVKSLSFAPDGERLLVTAQEDRLYRVTILNTGDGTMYRLLDDDRSAWDAVWSPDGRTIAFATEDGILLTEDEGRTTRQITPTGYMAFALEDGTVVSDLAWSPEGTHLAVSVFSHRLAAAVSTPVPYERVGPQLAVIDIATGELDLLTYGFTNSYPDWRPVVID
ncbi:MAG: PD40 domain-containing protein [Anaerolineae bacterium]|nr:PD40 domain-containing protein [Anaerolineae bacterium]